MAAKTGLLGMGTAGTVGIAVAGVVLVGLVGREVYLRAQNPVVAVEAPAETLDETATETPANSPANNPAATNSDSGPQTASQTADQAAASATTDPVAQTAPDLPPPLAAPRFDLVRVDPDGTAVIAGSGQAGSRVTLFLDDVEQDSAEIDSAGKFALFLALEASDQPRLMTMQARLGDQVAWSEDQIILAPTPTPTPTPEPRVASSPTQPPAEPTADSAAPTTQTPLSNDTAAGASETVVALADPAAEDVAATEPASPAPNTAQQSPEAMAAAPDGSASPAPSPAPDTPGADSAAPLVAEPGAPETPTEEPGDVAEPRTTPAPGPVAVLRAGADGVELLQPGTPERPQALDTLALDTISYTDDGEVLLSGRAPEGSAVRVYLDNRAVADLSIDAEGRWKGEVRNVRPGVYTLRLDQLATDGSVDGRLETPFKRESPAVLAAARADLPRNDPITAVTVQRGDTLWAISQDRYGEGVLYVRVFEANRDAIRDPDLIYPGQVFALPD